jgi:hypothetical protein
MRTRAGTVAGALCVLVGCRSSLESRVAKEPSSFQCTSEWEGRLVGGSSGAVVGIRFQGQIVKRLASGVEVPAREAVFVFDQGYENLQRKRVVHLTKGGGFDERYGLDFDTRRYCRNNAVVEKTTVESARILVQVKGCSESAGDLTEHGGGGLIVLECTEGAAAQQ